LSEDPVWDFPGNFGNGWGYVGGGVTIGIDPSGTMVAVETLGVPGMLGNLVSMQFAILFGKVALGATTYILLNELINQKTLLLHIRDTNLQALTEYNKPPFSLTTAMNPARIYWLPFNVLDYRFFIGVFVHFIPAVMAVLTGYGYHKHATSMAKAFGVPLPAHLQKPSRRPTLLVSAPRSSLFAPMYGGGLEVYRNSLALSLFDTSVYSEEAVHRSQYSDLGTLPADILSAGLILAFVIPNLLRTTGGYRDKI
jgi:hypothetical protein